MKYTTTDELEHFSFTEAYIADVQVTGGFFHMTLSNVTILPENSCNRDIREMRANDLVLKIEEPVIRSLVREGYKVYDANGILMRTARMRWSMRRRGTRRSAPLRTAHSMR